VPRATEATGSRSGRRGLLRDPLLVGLALYSLGAALWILFGPREPVPQARWFWVINVPLDTTLSITAWRVWRAAAGSARRFWLTLSGAAGLWALGDCHETLSRFAGDGIPAIDGGLLSSAGLAIGAAALGGVMLSYRRAPGPGPRRPATWLDAATILVGGGVLAWTFAIRPGDGWAQLVPGLVGVAAMVTAVYAGVRFGLSPQAPVSRRAATPMLVAAVLQGVVTFVPAGPVGTSGVPGWVLVLRLIPLVLIIAGARLQLLQARQDPTVFAPRVRKPYTPLPYLAIATVFGCLLALLPSGAQLWGVACGAVLVTALVIGRQLIAFHDNAELVGRLDRALQDLRGHEARLREQASVDALTGLANRGVLSAEAARLLPGAPALLLIDLDDFKTVNDLLGHPAGDRLLVQVAGRLRAWGPPGALIVRLGGDEFAVLLDGFDADAAAEAAQELLLHLAEPIQVAGRELLVRASVGLAVPGPGDDVDTLLSNADIAMYESKKDDRGLCVRYVPEMGQRIADGARLADQLREALDGGGLSLAYQPIVRLADERPVGVEALLRWRQPDGSWISPAQFIPVAEQTGLIVPIGRWVLHESCRQLAAWRRLGGPDSVTGNLTVSVNVAARQLRDPAFLADVAEVLQVNQLPAGALTVEVTENAVLQDEAVIAVLTGLRALGVMLALDDFGTAASSLGLLLTVPVTRLKLDRSFVESVTTVTRQAAVATAVIEMAHALGLDAVAEGIETREQAHLLRQLSYEHGQGYLFARPLPAAELTARWSGRSREEATA
jgi:diguanylate cyclase (GGDEF)-like protein